MAASAPNPSIPVASSCGGADPRQRVFGCGNLLVCDGSASPANVGGNPGLTITAPATHALGHVAAAGAEQEPGPLVA